MASRNINPLMLAGAKINRSSWQANGLVACWEPNVFPGGNTLYDRAGGNDGTITGADWTTDASQGHVLDFVATNSDYVTITDSAALSITGSFSIMCWCVIDLLDTTKRLICGKWDDVGGSYRCFALAIMSNDTMAFFISNDGTAWDYVSFASPATGVLYHCVGVFDGDWIYLYINGKLEAHKDTALVAIFDSNQPVYLGNASFGSGIASYFDGTVGEVRIYNRALSAAEIAAIYADPYQIWDVGEEEMEWAKAAAAAAAGNPHYYYQMLSKRRAS